MKKNYQKKKDDRFTIPYISLKRKPPVKKVAYFRKLGKRHQ